MARERNPTESQLDLLSEVAVDIKAMADRDDRRIWYPVHGNARRIKAMQPLIDAGILTATYADVGGKPAFFVHLVI